MATASLIEQTFDKNNGIFRLIPVFVPRRFAEAGRRLRLHPDDYYALGMARGSIKERWFSSVIRCMNGPLAAEDEGLSYCEAGSDRFQLREAVQQLGAGLIGETLMEKYGDWPMYSKFFDFKGPLFFHLHLDDLAAGRVGFKGKPEAYYFPPELNNYPGSFPHTYFGFDPDVTREQVKERLAQYEAGDNRITELSRAHRIQLGTGWYTPPGVLHAPGSYLTYEPQWNSDVNSVYENVVEGEIYSYEFLTENCPEDKKLDLDYVMDLMDWDANVDPHYKQKYFRPPLAIETGTDAYQENWITYGNEYFGAKELRVAPGQTVTVKDGAAYGGIMIAGFGSFGAYRDAASSTILRYGQRSADEYFVSEAAAKEGVVITNAHPTEEMVILKHFGPNHPDMPR